MLTGPRVWAALVGLCLAVSVGCFVVAGASRQASSSPSALGDAATTFGAVFVITSLCAFGGFAFSAAREATSSNSRPNGIGPAVAASTVLLLTAIIAGGLIVSETWDDGLELHPEPAGAGEDGTDGSDDEETPADPDCEPRTGDC